MSRSRIMRRSAARRLMAVGLPLFLCFECSASALPAGNEAAGGIGQERQTRDEERGERVEQQKALIRRAERLQTLMKRLLERYQAEDRRDYVVLLEEGLEHLEKSHLLKNLGIAASAIKTGQSNRAFASQRQVVEDLERLIGILLDRRSLDDLEADAKRVEQLLESVGRLKSRQRDLRKKLDELRERARTEQERQLVADLQELARKEREQARENVGLSSALQDQLETALQEVQKLQADERKLGDELESPEPGPAFSRMQRIQNLLEGVRRNLARAGLQREMQRAAQELRGLSSRLEDPGDPKLSPEDMEAARRQLENLLEAAKLAKEQTAAAGRQIPGHDSRSEAAELAKLADALQKALQDIEALSRKSGATEEGSPERTAAKLASGLAPELDRLAKGQDRLGADLEKALAEAAKELAREYRGEARESSGSSSSKSQAEQEAEQESSKVSAEHLDRAAKAMERAEQELRDALTSERQSREGRRRAESRNQQAMRHLERALRRQQAQNQSAEDLARKIRDRSRQLARDLAAVAGAEQAPMQASEALDQASASMEKAREQISRAGRTPDGQPGKEAGPRSQEARQEARQSLAKAEETLGREVERLRSRGTRATGEARARQAKLGKQAEDIARRAAESARSGEIAPEQKQAAEPSLERARKAMREAEARLAQGSPRAAARDQARAADELEDAARAIEESRPLGEDEQRALQELSRKQEELAEDILRLARRVEKKKNPEAREHLEQASDKANEAQQNMDEDDVAESEQAQRETEDKLDRAEQDLEKERDRYLKLRQEELLFKIADELKLMIDKQQDITQQTRSIVALRSDGPRARLKRPVRRKVQALGRREGSLAKTAEFLGKSLAEEQTLVFSWVLENVASDLKELRRLMSARRPRVDAYVLGLQVEIEETLGELLVSLKEEMRRKKQERDRRNQDKQDQKRPENTNEGDQKKRLVPDIAELRLLKRLEQKMRRRIDDFIRMREHLRPGLEPFQAERLNRLSLRHAKISDLFRDFVKTRGLGDSPHQKDEPDKEDTTPGEGTRKGGKRKEGK